MAVPKSWRRSQRSTGPCRDRGFFPAVPQTANTGDFRNRRKNRGGGALAAPPFFCEKTGFYGGPNCNMGKRRRLCAPSIGHEQEQIMCYDTVSAAEPSRAAQAPVIAAEKTPPRISPRVAALTSGIFGRVKNPVDTGFFTQELCATGRPKALLILHRFRLRENASGCRPDGRHIRKRGKNIERRFFISVS